MRLVTVEEEEQTLRRLSSILVEKYLQLLADRRIESETCAQAEWYNISVAFGYLRPQLFAIYYFKGRKYSVTFSRYRITEDSFYEKMKKLKDTLERISNDKDKIGEHDKGAQLDSKNDIKQLSAPERDLG